MKLKAALIILLFSHLSWGDSICQKILDEIDLARALPESLPLEQKQFFKKCEKIFQKEKTLCNKGRLYSCHAYGFYLSITQPKNVKSHFDYFEKSCLKKYPESCFMAAKRKFEIKNRRTPISIFEEFCQKGSNLACWRAAQAFAKKENYSSAMRNIKQACKYKDKIACGKVLFLKQGVEESIEKSLLLKQSLLQGQGFNLESSNKQKPLLISQIDSQTKTQKKEMLYCDGHAELIETLEREKRLLGKILAQFFNQAYSNPMSKGESKSLQLRYLLRLGVITSYELINRNGEKVRPQQGPISKKAQTAFKKIKEKAKVYSSKLSTEVPVMAIPIFRNQNQTTGLFFFNLKGIQKLPKEKCKSHLDQLLALYLFARSKLYLEQLYFYNLKTDFLKNQEGLDSFFLVDSLGKIMAPLIYKDNDINDSFTSKAFDTLIRNSVSRPFFIESKQNSDYVSIAHVIKKEGQVIPSGVLSLRLKISR